MKSKDELAWDVFIKLLERDDVHAAMHMAEDVSKYRVKLFRFASDTAYDYLLWTQGELK